VNAYVYVLQVSRLEMLTEGPTPEEAAVVKRHVEYLQGLAGSGALVLAGRTQTESPDTFGIAVFRAADDAEAMRVMEADPAVSGGVMRARLFPFRVAVAGCF
jgi:uncharacterized protein YciI